MRFARRGLAVVLAAPLLLAAACRGDRDRSRHELANAKFAARDSSRQLGPGDIQITNADSSVEIALVGDSLVAGLGRKVLDKVRENTDTSAVTGGGFGASIEKMVKSTVAGAMSHQLLFPLSEIQDIRYEDGTLRFYGTDGKPMRMFEDTHENGKQVSATFRAEDARRFIAAFKAKKAGTPAR